MWAELDGEPMNETDYLMGLLIDVADSGVAFEDPRLDYLDVQIHRDTWNALLAVRAKKAP